MTGSEYARISGSYSTAFIGTYQVLSQSTANNTTTFRLRGYFYYGGGTSVSSSYSTFQVNGTNVKTGSYNYSNGYHLLGSKDITVTHNNDGSFPTTNASIYANSYHMSGSKSGRIYANKINRYANLTEAPNFNDEQNPTIKYSNPAGNNVNVLQACISLTGAKDDVPYRNINKTGNSYTFELTENERNILRNASKNRNSITVKFYVKTVINGATNFSTLNRTFSIINANPTFSNFEFEDVNPTTLALTGNNQNIIQGYSNVKATIPVEYIATANKYATMSKYSFVVSDAQRDITYSSDSSTNNTIENVKSGVFNVYAIDSRNNSTLVTKNANQTISYNPLVKGNISIARQNGVAEETNLTISGTIDLVDFGNVVNSIQEAKYRYKITDSSTWSNYTDITVSVDNDGNISFNDLIEGDTGDGFDIGHSYNIEVLISDELSTIVYTANLGSGIPNIALHKNGVGIMGKYDTTEGGLLQIAGKNIFRYSTNEYDTGYKWIDGRTIYGKVFELTVGNDSNISFNHNLTNIGMIRVNQGDSFVYNGSESLPASWYYSSSDWARTWANSTTIRFRSPSSLGSRTLYAIIEYTKTTD